MAKLINGNYSKSAFKKACTTAIDRCQSMEWHYTYCDIGNFYRKSDGAIVRVTYDMRTNKFRMETSNKNLCHYDMMTVRGALDFVVNNNYRYNVTIDNNTAMPNDQAEYEAMMEEV